MIKFTSCLPMVWFSSGTPASSTTKTGPHDIAEILLKVALNTISLTLDLLKGIIMGGHNLYRIFNGKISKVLQKIFQLEKFEDTVNRRIAQSQN